MLAAVLFFIGAWFCLLSSGVNVPENPSDLSDTRGLPAVIIYIVALQVLGVMAIISSGLGVLVCAKFKPKSIGISRAIFFISNFLLLFISLVGVFVIVSFVFETVLGLVGILLYIGVICLTFTAIPKKNESRGSDFFK